MRLALLLLVACAQPHEPPQTVGERPLECDPPPASGSDDVNARTGPAATIMMPLPLIDPDCTSTSSQQIDTTAVLTWTGGATTTTEAMPVTRRSTWKRIGSDCHVWISITHHAALVGRAGSIQPCGADLLSDAWASFSSVPVRLDSLSVDGVDVALTGPLPWRGESRVTSCDQPPIVSTSLALGFAAELTLSLADWRRLHASNPPVVALQAVIRAD